MELQTLPVKVEDLDGPEAKQILGERLYALIEVEQGSLAGKITGMLLHGLDNSELVALIDDQAALQSRIQEALVVLEAYQQAQRLRVDLQAALKTAHLPPAAAQVSAEGASRRARPADVARTVVQVLKRPYATPPPPPPLDDGDHIGLMSGGPLVTAVVEAGGEKINSCQRRTRSGTPLYHNGGAVDKIGQSPPRMTPRSELEDIKSWSATQQPSPSVITRMDIGNRIPSYCGNAPVHAARAHNRCVKPPNVNKWWKRGRKEFYGWGTRGALQDKSGCGECCVC
jgi:hypothetical protein